MSSGTSSTPTPGVYESVSLISDSIGRSIKGDSLSGAIVDPVVVSNIYDDSCVMSHHKSL